MAIGRTNAGGGGGGGLNFKVVGGTTAPTSPKENTIWVNTSVTIPSWAFSATEPGSPVEGMVWISTGTSSTVAFNALKKNDIQAYPVSAKQYVSSQWVSVEAKSYQGGEWVSWIRYLYNKGDMCTALGGEWVAKAVALESSTNKVTPTLTEGDSTLTMSIKSNGGGIVQKNDKIDLTDVDTLSVTGDFTAGSSPAWLKICVWTSIGTYSYQNLAVYLGVSTSGNNATYTIDVSSLEGEYYIGFSLYGTVTKVVLHEMSLK